MSAYKKNILYTQQPGQTFYNQLSGLGIYTDSRSVDFSKFVKNSVRYCLQFVNICVPCIEADKERRQRSCERGGGNREKNGTIAQCQSWVCQLNKCIACDAYTQREKRTQRMRHE